MRKRDTDNALLKEWQKRNAEQVNYETIKGIKGRKF